MFVNLRGLQQFNFAIKIKFTFESYKKNTLKLLVLNHLKTLYSLVSTRLKTDNHVISFYGWFYFMQLDNSRGSSTGCVASRGFDPVQGL